MANRSIVDRANMVFRKLEKIGILTKTPNFVFDYEKDYPGLKILETNYEIIRRECEQILKFKEEITDVKNLMGEQTQSGIHVIQWKSYMLKSDGFVEENCRRCPETTKLLKKIPGIWTAFFSILEPGQYITPHEGYFDGFMRYHLGVIIPNNNEDNSCWIRIANAEIEKRLLPEQGEKYFWKNGAGVIFNDNYTHDASNESDQLRVILWLDVERKMSFVFKWINKLMLTIAFSTKGLKQIAKNAIVAIEEEP